MVPDLDIYRSAQVLVTHHGPDALLSKERPMGATVQ